ncbi:hypothetical protein F5Y18DRAFT_406402 [Xylariaceae sp. FL1019]|nr:hypothetical protein F5Y18DRAFT_406402 [Xylariaceae sp. FL1019]
MRDEFADTGPSIHTTESLGLGSVDTFTPINGSEVQTSNTSNARPTIGERPFPKSRDIHETRKKRHFDNDERILVFPSKKQSTTGQVELDYPILPPLASSPTPFQSLKVTKAFSAFDNPLKPKSYHSLASSYNTYLDAQTCGSGTSYTGSESDRYVSSPKLEEARQQTVHSTRHGLADEELTTAFVWPAVNNNQFVYEPQTDSNEAWKSQIAEAVQDSPGVCDGSPQSDDEYPLGCDIEEEDMINLLAVPQGAVYETHAPPSSVQQDWDHESRSDVQFDPNLQYSSPLPSSETSNEGQAPSTIATGQCLATNDESLLDEEVDWHAVYDVADSIEKRSSSSIYSQPGKRALMAGRTATSRSNPMIVDSTVSADTGMPLSSFVRPPFPDRVRDRPFVPGASATTLLRTCFRIGVMISQTAWSHNHRQDVVFELYARVTYSNRETMSRKQHFQLVDLFKDQQPYPAATLANWKSGTQLEHDSAVFLDTHTGPRLCWCICKPLRDTNAAIGWTYTVLRIKETTWEQIEWAKRVVGDQSLE